MDQPIRIGIVAPSAKVPQVELKLGLERIRQEGFSVDLHPQCKKSHLFFAGTDEERAGAFFEYAKDSAHSVIWCARGGHGALRMLPRLESLEKQFGIPPRKLLVGYSDVTALMEFVRKRWGWATLHAPMPSLRKFSILSDLDWQAMKNWIQGQEAQAPWANTRLQYWTPAPSNPIEGKLVGGNLTVWNCLLSTRFQASADDCILFLEDVDESLYRIDRAMQQLLLSGSLDRVRAIVLGNFLNCKDYSPLVLKSAPKGGDKKRLKLLSAPKPKDLKPLRKVMKELPTLQAIFAEIGQTLKIPIAYGLPVGHGPGVSPLPLGGTYQLDSQGRLKLLKWDWTGTKS
jgi:muramoyltetrapeptide carboxypeptidase